MGDGLVFAPAIGYLESGKEVRVLWWKDGKPAVFYKGRRNRKCRQGINGKINEAKRKALERSNWTCERCGLYVWETKLIHPRTLTVDHIVSMCAGGHPFAEDNIQVLCVECHRIKDKEEKEERGTKRLTPSSAETKVPPSCSTRSSRTSNPQPSSSGASSWGRSSLPP